MAATSAGTGSGPGTTPAETETIPAETGDRNDDGTAAPEQRPVGRARRAARRLGALALPVLLALAGAWIGILLTPATPVQVGPLAATVQLRPALEGRTVILLPPVGEVAFDTHAAPVTIEARVRSVDIDAAQELIYSSEARSRLERDAPDDITSAAIRNAGLHALFATVGAAGMTALGWRRVRRSVVAGGVALGLTAATCGAVALTFRPQALAQPQFDGLLSQAATLVDLGQGTAFDYSSYRSTISQFVNQVSALYVAADSLPQGLGAHGDLITVLHVSDIHDNPQAFDVIRQISGQFDVDAVVDTGDIVSWGTPFEDAQLSTIGTLGVPYVFVAGNHDGAGAVATISAQPNATVLNNQVAEVAGLRIAGIGDPRFAADDSTDAGDWQAGTHAIAATTAMLGETIDEYDAAHPEEGVDLALIHDPTQPEGLLGRVPLVLSGHMHSSNIQLDRDGSGTDWMTVGSSGGALASGGVLPVLDGGEPLGLEARLLYFDASTHRLVAYDDVRMGGLGLVSVSIQRHQMPTDDAPLEVPEDAVEPPTEDPGVVPSVEPGTPVPDDQRVTPSATDVPSTPADPSAPEQSPSAPATTSTP
ncbi:metallophosphoesterase family protein [Brachybacterium huguangmaarense]